MFGSPHVDRLKFLALCAVMSGCGGERGGDDSGDTGVPTTSATSLDDGATDGSTGGDSGGDCKAGSEGCPCVDGDLCSGLLVCIEGTCEASGDATGDDGSDTGACEPGTVGCECDEGPGFLVCDSPWVCDEETSICVPENTTACTSNAECAETEVCYASECQPITLLLFDVRIINFAPPSCTDGVGGKELYFEFQENGAFKLSSPTVGCPASWANFGFSWDGLYSFRLSFWEEDAFADDFEVSTCWDDGTGECGPIPGDIVRAGGLTGTIGDEYGFEFTLEPCGFYDQPELCP